INSWMCHNDHVTRLAEGFRQYGASAAGCPSVVVHESKPWYGVQFHPESANCERGLELLAAFVFGVSQCSPGWSMDQYVKEVCQDVARRVGSKPVLLLISGGVDSTVVAALLLKALNADQVHLLHIDTGLMRKNETSSVKVSLERLGSKNLHIINCEEEFLGALKGVVDPEAKRKAIGDLFITIQERETKRLGLTGAFLAQGTIYPDILESGKGPGKNAKVIKSHHNVGSALVDAKRRSGLVIEPLEKLFKDEVRSLGRFLGVDEEVLRRHPFPGPGISVRILGEVTREKCDILREADVIYMEELKKRRGPGGKSLYDEIWQAFPVLLPLRSTGILENSRNYGWVLALRAIISTDAMTASVYPFQMVDLLEISARITAEVKGIGRVTYDITGKPPATIEWE
ncbi:MAG: glutamine-hydrolyzing GMP synthase, partial [Treponema sp.]|nr:glutamine-hydrolyzing GMP synthase [Treponema sp.]